MISCVMDWDCDLLVGFMEAAPRLELGVKDLQSSALPLGYTALHGQLF